MNNGLEEFFRTDYLAKPLLATFLGVSLDCYLPSKFLNQTL